jgi:hypothetical protein
MLALPRTNGSLRNLRFAGLFSGVVPSMFARLITTSRQFAVQLLTLLVAAGLLAVFGGLFPFW